jgi:hypothetical protein
MMRSDSLMKPRTSRLLALCSTGFAAVVYVQSTAAVSPQSLAGDWEYAISPPLKLVLHLQVDASGALTGSVDTPDTPPKHIELMNVHLAGNMLSYSMGSQPGTFREVISADDSKMLGPHLWVRTGATQTAAPLIPLKQIAGDWVPPGGGAWPQVLRLRLDPGGALTGTIDAQEPMSARMKLSNVQVTGRTLSYSLPDGNRFQGTFGDDSKTVKATPASTVDATWQHIRTAAQAAANDAAEKSKPTNGVWSGAGNYIASFPGIPSNKGTLQLTLHFGSDPALCSVGLVGKERSDTVPCQLTLTGNTVQVKALRVGAFSGTLSADGNHLGGAWTMGSDWHWTGPMQIDLTRVAQPAQ